MALDVAGVTIKPTDELCSRARDFAAVVKAWSDTNVQARIARGKPLPGSLRPERKPKTKRRPAVSPVRVAPISDALKPPTEPAP